MVFNFQLNNEITYRDQRLRGPRLWRGLLLFMLVCGVGAVANVGIAQAAVREQHRLEHRRRDRRDDRRGVELRRLGHAGLARAVTAHLKPLPAFGALAALTLLRLAVAATGAARAGRGVLLGVVARAGARLSRPSADGGALDASGHGTGRRHAARYSTDGPAVGGGCLAAADRRRPSACCRGGAPGCWPPRCSTRRCCSASARWS